MITANAVTNSMGEYFFDNDIDLYNCKPVSCGREETLKDLNWKDMQKTKGYVHIKNLGDALRCAKFSLLASVAFNTKRFDYEDRVKIYRSGQSKQLIVGNSTFTYYRGKVYERRG